MKKILVIGAAGQIGSELVPYLRQRYGNDNVIAADVRTDVCAELKNAGPFAAFDATRAESVAAVVDEHKPDTIYNLVALLSAVGEKNPQMAWAINMGSLLNILEVAREKSCAVFTPSSIGAFGPTSPLDPSPQDCIMRPRTMYGVSKVAGELLCDYYFAKFGVDTRGVRYPGIISNVAPPGGGTTDYAVHIYYCALEKGHFTCNLKAGTYLDMMYMPDCLRAAVEIMEADPARLVHRNAFNVAAMSFEPETIAAEIRKHLPDFTMDYAVDPTIQAIADSWPNRMEDDCATAEWGWKHEWDLERMTKDMLEVLGKRLAA